LTYIKIDITYEFVKSHYERLKYMPAYRFFYNLIIMEKEFKTYLSLLGG